MTDELKHSELPWSVTKKNWAAIEDAKGERVCSTNLLSNDDANAKLIVESVNNAARYKEALEFYADENNYDDDYAPIIITSEIHRVSDVGLTARNALNIKED